MNLVIIGIIITVLLVLTAFQIFKKKKKKNKNKPIIKPTVPEIITTRQKRGSPRRKR